MNSATLRRLLFVAFALVALLGRLPAASAQQTPRLRLLVVGAPAAGLSAKQAGDLIEESAYIADDFGLYAVTRSYQVEAVAGRDLARAVERCNGKESCLVPALSGSLFDYVLLVQPTAVRDGVEVAYKMLDVRAGITAASTLARLPGPVEFAYLLAACQEALKATPDYIAPAAAAPPVALQQPVVQPMFASEPSQPGLSTPAWFYASGTALLATGTLLGFAADDVQQELQARPHTSSKVESLQDEGESKQRFANVAFGLGAVALATGVVIQVLDAEEPRASRIELRSDLRSVSLDWRF